MELCGGQRWINEDVLAVGVRDGIKFRELEGRRREEASVTRRKIHPKNLRRVPVPSFVFCDPVRIQ